MGKKETCCEGCCSCSEISADSAEERTGSDTEAELRRQLGVAHKLLKAKFEGQVVEKKVEGSKSILVVKVPGDDVSQEDMERLCQLFAEADTGDEDSVIVTSVDVELLRVQKPEGELSDVRVEAVTK